MQTAHNSLTIGHNNISLSLYNIHTDIHTHTLRTIPVFLSYHNTLSLLPPTIRTPKKKNNHTQIRLIRFVRSSPPLFNT